MARMQPSLDTRALYEALKKANPDEIITYEDLNKVVDGNVQNAKRCYLNSARKMVHREDKKVFRPVIGIGLKCLGDSDIAGLAGPAIRHYGKSARRVAREIVCVQNFNGLSEEKKVQHNTGLTLLGLVDHCVKPKNVKQVQMKVQEAKVTLSMNKTLDCFRED